MFKDETAEDDEPADEIGDAKAAKEAKGDQYSAHDHVGQKGGPQGVFRAPSYDERMQAVRFVEFIILEGVNDVESDQP